MDPEVTRQPAVRPIFDREDESTVGGGGGAVSPAGADDATQLLSGTGTRTSPGTGPLAPGQRFGPRYRIIRLLGMGGMGAVYQAWDAELDVVVAVKVIRPEATSDPRETRAIERRFKQELLLARQVTHKNVVRIHDLGEIDGIKYITMSYIEGADLATVLKGAGKLPVSEALKIMRQVASGLQAAHEAGVVHRDLKPANIMVEGEHAIIMDFGIARSASGEGPALPAGTLPPGVWQNARNAPQATVVGTVVGTVAYMAPEQARGEKVDQRADLYALGLIVSDMLLGPRARSHTLEELKRRMKEAPPALRSADPQIPEALERIVSRCVQPDPAARFQTTAELVAALDRLDGNGKLKPLVRRLTPRMVAATATLVIAMLGGTYFVTRRAVEPVAQHDPVSVVIADFANSTNDPTFDRTLEPMLKIALEGAGFISAYDRSVISRTIGVRPPETLNERTAQELAAKQGLGVVVSGSIEREGNRFNISMRAIHAITGNVIADVSDTASSKEQVLAAATGLAGDIREALGDDTSDADRRFAMETLSATSLDVVRDYASAALAMSNSAYKEAFDYFSKAAARDPDFGLAHAGMAIASRNLDRQQDAERYIKEAVSHLDGMTERERYRTRGLFYMIMGDSQQCVKEFGDLVARYAADAPARNNLALCLTYLREFPRALDEMQQVVRILPRRAMYRENLALYAAYGGNFPTAEQEARAIENPRQYALLALAFAQLGQGQVLQATATYQAIGKLDQPGPSYEASGLGDVALYEGRFADAARIYADGAAADLTSKDTDRAANKLAALAYTQLLRRQPGAAIAAAEKALANSNAVSIRFLAARVFVEAGTLDRARALAAGLGSELLVEPQAYAKIIEGGVALKSGDARQAVKVLSEANALLDTWIGHFDLGRAFLEAGAFTQADSEFDRCIRRRGETLALFMEEEPTFGYFLPPVYYYQGRVREALGSAGFAESYRAYLTIRGQSKEDPLLPEVRRRAGG